MKFQITLKAARINAGLSLLKAAEKIGVGKDTLSKWEKNSGLVNPIKHQAISNAYKIPINVIFFGTLAELNSAHAESQKKY